MFCYTVASARILPRMGSWVGAGFIVWFPTFRGEYQRGRGAIAAGAGDTFDVNSLAYNQVCLLFIRGNYERGGAIKCDAIYKSPFVNE